ncbi:MAG TPA: hypothetical protein VFU47_10020, partial [Armatimonadota bacterium]|nr:hypothetical protein [Armatimonadota bacterium]
FSVETFPDGAHSSTVSLGEGRYEVRSFVDQDPEEGQRVRYDFTCRVRYDGGRWVLERLTVQNLAGTGAASPPLGLRD